jgi:hypothetical protein
MSLNKKKLSNNGGGLNNCGIAEPDSFESSLYVPILEEWYRVTNKSISWVNTQKGYFLNPTINYKPVYNGTHDKNCTHFTTHIHLIRCSYQINPIEKKGSIIIHYTVKIKNYNVTNDNYGDRFIILPDMFTSAAEKAAYKDHYIVFHFDLPKLNISKKPIENFIYDKYVSYANDIILELQKDYEECNNIYKNYIKTHGTLTTKTVTKGKSKSKK